MEGSGVMQSMDIVQMAATAHYAFLRRKVALVVQAYTDGLDSLSQADRSELLRWVGFYATDYMEYREKRGLKV